MDQPGVAITIVFPETATAGLSGLPVFWAKFCVLVGSAAQSFASSDAVQTVSDLPGSRIGVTRASPIRAVGVGSGVGPGPSASIMFHWFASGSSRIVASNEPHSHTTLLRSISTGSFSVS